MKIALFVNNIDQIGGAEIGTRRLAERLTQRDQQIILIGTQSISQWRIHFRLIDYAKNIQIIRLPVWQHSRRTFRQTLILHARWLFPLLHWPVASSFRRMAMGMPANDNESDAASIR